MAGSKATKKEETKVTVKPKVVDKKSIDLSKLKDFKNKNGFNEDVKDKELDWIPISKAFTEATGLAGIPKGYITLSRGFSNTGKSTSLMEAIVSSQKLGILPVIIDTENNFSWEHAKDMGLQFDEVIDTETGEVVNYDGFFIFINNEYLIDNYGKKR
jgi:RecA/RadA recombinase